MSESGYTPNESGAGDNISSDVENSGSKKDASKKKDSQGSDSKSFFDDLREQFKPERPKKDEVDESGSDAESIIAEVLGGEQPVVERSSEQVYARRIEADSLEEELPEYTESEQLVDRIEAMDEDVRRDFFAEIAERFQSAGANLLGTVDSRLVPETDTDTDEAFPEAVRELDIPEAQAARIPAAEAPMPREDGVESHAPVMDPPEKYDLDEDDSGFSTTEQVVDRAMNSGVTGSIKGADFDYGPTRKTTERHPPFTKPETNFSYAERKSAYNDRFWLGFLSGGAVAGLWSRRKRKKVERRLGKQIDSQEKEIKEIRNDIQTRDYRKEGAVSRRPVVETAIPKAEAQRTEKVPEKVAVAPRPVVPERPPSLERMSRLQEEAGTTAEVAPKPEKSRPAHQEAVPVRDQQERRPITSSERFDETTRVYPEKVPEKYVPSDSPEAKRDKHAKFVGSAQTASKTRSVFDIPNDQREVELRLKKYQRDMKTTDKKRIDMTVSQLQAATWVAYATVLLVFAIIIFVFVG